MHGIRPHPERLEREIKQVRRAQALQYEKGNGRIHDDDGYPGDEKRDLNADSRAEAENHAPARAAAESRALRKDKEIIGTGNRGNDEGRQKEREHPDRKSTRLNS